jgi:hypothetical protein
MKYLKLFLLLFISFTFFSCSSARGEEKSFMLLQDGKNYRGEVIELKKEPFTIVSPSEKYSFIIATEPIKLLGKNREIVKLVGTGLAWEKGDAPLYDVRYSGLLSDDEACDAYFGYRKEGCDVYKKEKTKMGFRKHYAYTFSALYPNIKEWKVEKINKKKIEKIHGSTFYLYLFKQTGKLGEVATTQKVQLIKIKFK